MHAQNACMHAMQAMQAMQAMHAMHTINAMHAMHAMPSEAIYFEPLLLVSLDFFF